MRVERLVALLSAHMWLCAGCGASPALSVRNSSCWGETLDCGAGVSDGIYDCESSVSQQSFVAAVRACYLVRSYPTRSPRLFETEDGLCLPDGDMDTAVGFAARIERGGVAGEDTVDACITTYTLTEIDESAFRLSSAPHGAWLCTRRPGDGVESDFSPLLSCPPRVVRLRRVGSRSQTRPLPAPGAS